MSQIWNAKTAKPMKIDPYCQRWNCSPMHFTSMHMYALILLGPLGVPPSIFRMGEIGDFQPVRENTSQRVNNTAK